MDILEELRKFKLIDAHMHLGVAANTLYYRSAEGNLLLVSEPLDQDRESWIPVPPNHMVVAKAGQAIEIAPIDLAMRVAAE